jgi:hypothetical protein
MLNWSPIYSVYLYSLMKKAPMATIDEKAMWMNRLTFIATAALEKTQDVA